MSLTPSSRAASWKINSLRSTCGELFRRSPVVRVRIRIPARQAASATKATDFHFTSAQPPTKSQRTRQQSVSGGGILVQVGRPRRPQGKADCLARGLAWVMGRTAGMFAHSTLANGAEWQVCRDCPLIPVRSSLKNALRPAERSGRPRRAPGNSVPRRWCASCPPAPRW